MADAAKKPFWRTRKGLILIGAAIVVAVFFAKAQKPKFPPDPDCGEPKIAVGNDRIGEGDNIYFAVTGPATGQYTLTWGVDKLERATPDTTDVKEPEEGAGDQAAILGEKIDMSTCFYAGQTVNKFDYGKYTLRLWDTTGADPVQVAELTVTSTGS